MLAVCFCTDRQCSVFENLRPYPVPRRPSESMGLKNQWVSVTMGRNRSGTLSGRLPVFWNEFADLDSPYAVALEAINDDMRPYIE